MSSTDLTDLSLFEPIKRGQYQQVLAAADKISQLYRQGKAGGDVSALALEAESYAKHILANKALLLGALPDYLQSNSEYFVRSFVKSIYLWLQLPYSSGRSHYDSLGCETHKLYAVDLVLEECEWPLVDQVLEGMGIPERMIRDVRGEVAAQTSNCQIKRLIAGYLSERLQSTSDHLGLFQQMYGDIDIPPNLVDVIITDAQLFFCVPYDNDGLIDAAKYRWLPQHNENFSRFLQGLALESATERVYFPSVGVFNRKALDVTLIEELTVYIQQQGEMYRNVSQHIVIETLGSMLLLMASQEIEKFLIHDAWGHAWQETLCDFEWLYIKMGKFRQPLSILKPSIYSEAPNDCLGAAISRDSNDGLAIDYTAMDQWIRRDIRGRVTVALNACVAELTADMAEYKFAPIAESNGLEFPSSSVLASHIVRLDLTFSDAAKHIDSLASPYLSLAKGTVQYMSLVNELLQCGYSDSESHRVLEAIVQHIAVHYRQLLSTENSETSALHSDNTHDVLSLYEMMQINLCSIFCSLHHYKRFGEDVGRTENVSEEGAEESVDVSDRTCHFPEQSLDFVTLAIACFFEEDRQKNIWHVDEILESPLREMIHQFGVQWRLLKT
ncbi:hypothetical protein A9Q99_07455 [Gammaproteobacteria bacterium 45_16_T64]|nr:hypothetical protein A9Q99_07455 [Gammaproteobacteria bacterium 45_16_T64]